MLIVIKGYIVVTLLVFARKSVDIFIKILNVFTLCVTINTPQLTSPHLSLLHLPLVIVPRCHALPYPTEQKVLLYF